MHLVPFRARDYHLLIQWVPTESFNLFWGGPLYDWPLTVAQIQQHQQRDDVSAFLLVHAGQKIGFIELITETPEICRLCRVLIAEHCHRGRGYGRDMVRLAMVHAQRQLSAKLIRLAVFEHNLAAIRCYSALGFRVIARKAHSRYFDNRWWPLLQMELAL